MRVLGLMSGTSADGIDVALVRIRPRGLRLDATVEDFTSLPYPRRVCDTLLRVAEGGATSTRELSQLNYAVGKLFADAALAACRKFRISPRRVDLIGSHGQTIYHQGRASRFPGAGSVASTWQIGEPAVIAERTGITTVGDFRAADVAAGGQGAPLVPYVDYLLYRDARHGRVALNIGGIANVTVIPAGAEPGDVMAFDTGPGNMIVDGLVRRFTHGRRTYDREARMAMRGRVVHRLLDELMKEPYLRQAPPKTAGREQFGAAYVERMMGWGKKKRARPEDLVRTATLFTALGIVDAFHRWIFPRTRVQQLIVSGGGAHNPLMMAQIEAGLRRIEVVRSGRFGVPEDAKEAFAFAILAYETLRGRPGNLPGATGARRAVILGKVCRV